jgi:hypothetical protein
LELIVETVGPEDGRRRLSGNRCFLAAYAKKDRQNENGMPQEDYFRMRRRAGGALLSAAEDLLD